MSRQARVRVVGISGQAQGAYIIYVGARVRVYRGSGEQRGMDRERSVRVVRAIRRLCVESGMVCRVRVGGGSRRGWKRGIDEYADVIWVCWKSRHSKHDMMFAFARGMI